MAGPPFPRRQTGDSDDTKQIRKDISRSCVAINRG